MSVSLFVFAHEVTVPPYTSSPPPSSRTSRRVVIPPGTPAHLITTLIKNGKKKDEKIATLHLVAHGAPGLLFLRGGKYPPIDTAGVWWFGALRNHFEKTFPMVIIHGCNSASNVGHNPTTGVGWYGHNQMGVGFQFCKVMAQATQAIVQAAVNRQSNDRLYQMEGPTITVGPNGAAMGAEYSL